MTIKHTECLVCDVWAGGDRWLDWGLWEGQRLFSPRSHQFLHPVLRVQRQVNTHTHTHTWKHKHTHWLHTIRSPSCPLQVWSLQRCVRAERTVTSWVRWWRTWTRSELYNQCFFSVSFTLASLFKGPFYLYFPPKTGLLLLKCIWEKLLIMYLFCISASLECIKRLVSSCH